ncbi:MAG: hypothetical protein EP330_20205 [Deltaproteobacteria bacterium]|nr:MAG: hypothetical protein EP330_20205 [Deltaproteobacteria bacterium]
MEAAEFQRQLRDLLANRHTAEARALYLTLLQYIDRRVSHLVRRQASGIFSDSEREELVGEVLMQLISGSLATFRGESIGELMAFVRTVSDRTVFRHARRRIRERDTVREEADQLESWFAEIEGPSARVSMVEDCPLDAEDEAYLRALLTAGSKVELARERGTSRAAVTQRVQRIQRRIAKLPRQDQLAVEAWLRRAARETLGV